MNMLPCVRCLARSLAGAVLVLGLLTADVSVARASQPVPGRWIAPAPAAPPLAAWYSELSRRDRVVQVCVVVGVIALVIIMKRLNP
jgi:hypothetical protein